MPRPRPPPAAKVRQRNWINSLLLIWVAAAVTFVGPGTANEIDYEMIYPGVSECHKGPTNITCNLQPGKKYRIDNFNWTQFTKVEIFGKGNNIMIRHPLCSDQERHLHIYNATQVITTTPEDTCGIQLFLYNCTGVNVVGGVNMVRMVSSVAEKIDLENVRQFDLENSIIGEVSVTINKKMSTLDNSTIERVNLLKINGNFQFRMTNCTLNHVNKFIYNNDREDPQIHKLMVGHVYQDGIRVLRGTLNLEADFDVVEPLGIQVMSKAALKLNLGIMHTFSEDSIATQSLGYLSVNDMTLGEYPSISFTFKDANFLAYPLSFLTPPQGTPMGWIACGVAFGLVVGCVATVGLTYFVKRKYRFARSGDTNTLLSQEQCPPQGEKDTDSLSKNHNLPKAMPAPPNRPLPNVPNGTDQDEYDEILPPTSTEKTPQPEIVQRPPCVLPKEPQSTKPTLSLSIKDRFRGKTNILPPVMKYSKHDSRDALPPPPPPAEELYDDPGDMSLQLPPPPPTANRPQLPPPPQPPDEGGDLYDDPEDISLRAPLPPPSVNKPMLNKGKPAPPPPSRKPMKR